MKPFSEQMETSGMNSSDGEHENLQWSLSITNVPCSVFEDENTKVRFGNVIVIVFTHTYYMFLVSSLSNWLREVFFINSYGLILGTLAVMAMFPAVRS